jgi:hypothetical protein
MPEHNLSKGAAAFITAAAYCIAAATAGASDPSLARYTDDPTNVFWFVQITDTYINTVYHEGEEMKMEWALRTGVDVVDPWFVVNTGNLTDASNGIIIGAGQQEDEWREYRNIAEGAGMTAEFYFDMPGNHDAYRDGGLEYYLNWSIQGFARHITQPHWRIELPFGSYHFVGIATPDNGLVDPLGSPEITDGEYNELLAALDAHADTNLTMALGHHEYEAADGGERVDELLASYGVPCYLHGHEHDHRAKVSTHGVVVQRIDSLGKSDDHNFCVHAVDADCFSHTCVSADEPWPLAVITAPVDTRLDDDDDVNNPYAPSVPVTCTEAPIRILAFDSELVSTVSYFWDNAEAGPLAQSEDIPPQWKGTFDATSFVPGVHTLSVEVIGGTRTRDFEIQVLFADRPCDVTPPPAEEEAPEPAPDLVGEEPGGEPAEPIGEPAPDTAPDAVGDLSIPEITTDAVQQDAGDENGGGLGGEISGGGCACSLAG